MSGPAHVLAKQQEHRVAHLAKERVIANSQI